MNPLTNLIALFARGRELGYVLMDARGIYRYGVKSIRGKRDGPDFLRRVAKALFSLLKLAGSESLIVIERMNASSRKGKLSSATVEVIRRSAFDVYSLMEVDIPQVKQHLVGTANATHETLIDAVVMKYPITQTVKANKPHQVRYWMPMLMALALADFAKAELKLPTS